ncbi:DNA/RNA helicase SNF2 [Legionella londiniensis]|uniref:DNA/RNA helicase SNF2 n=1 Tax=Legionella londiniensis TaxID=45068 RepID=A0A0W0VKV5_9GAMM|nr:DEAD/DEAH box helicase [Legionella londiniensis]KTD20735.1 DNA/RNA helicase SNF2 [Legionella londiniensis]STX92792.1 DNA/RNA helicase SNF2 [Legionella londiniensis]
MLNSALSQMDKIFSPATLQLAHEYQAQGYVFNLLLSDGLVKARVKDKTRHFCNVYLDLKTWPATPGSCSCGLSGNCEHVAACLFALHHKEFGSTAEPVLKTEKYPEPVKILNASEVIWHSKVHESSKNFFSYQLGIEVNGQTVSLLPMITDLLNRWDRQTLESLSDKLLLNVTVKRGIVLKIELGRLKPLLRFLLEYSSGKKKAEEMVHIKPYQLLLMLEAESAIHASQARWQGTEEIRRKLKALSELIKLPQIEPPKGLCIPLRDYQRQGLNWLQGLRAAEFGGILADDMGLGKTVQTLAHLLCEKEHGRMKDPCLIVAPTSLLGNWAEEAKRFAPSLDVSIFHGASRNSQDFKKHDLIVTTYALIQRDRARFLTHSFYYLILDEAQFIKNSRTKTRQIIQQISARHRLCLTGTPLENHLGELWSLFHFLMPGFLGQAKQFRQYFEIPIEKYEDENKKSLLVRRISPFLLRRSKNDVLKELPDKTEMNHMIELSGKQRDLYETIRISMEQKVRDAIVKQGLGRSRITILDALLKLRQICCDPRLLPMPVAASAHLRSAKLEALMELLENLIEEGRFMLIFSQFTSMLRLIEEKLIRNGYPYLKLTGKTQNRQNLVNRFQQGEVPVFLISLKAGGTGLNLSRADTVIHYDPWWNPAVEDQATDRSHRLGQENPVFVYKLITKGTVEEAILQLQEKKRRLIFGVLNSKDSGELMLTEEDITQFFKPLGEG